MNPNELVISITAAAAAIAADIPDDGQLAVAAAAFVQLGDALATIAAQRALLGNNAKSK